VVAAATVVAVEAGLLHAEEEAGLETEVVGVEEEEVAVALEIVEDAEVAEAHREAEVCRSSTYCIYDKTDFNRRSQRRQRRRCWRCTGRCEGDC